MKIGDLITAYSAGYHELLDITDLVLDEFTQSWSSNKHLKVGDKIGELYHYSQRFDSNGNQKISSKIKVSNAGFCKPALESVRKEIEDLEVKSQKLLKIVL